MSEPVPITITRSRTWVGNRRVPWYRWRTGFGHDVAAEELDPVGGWPNKREAVREVRRFARRYGLAVDITHENKMVLP